jgi:hypothetical protein
MLQNSVHKLINRISRMTKQLIDELSKFIKFNQINCINQSIDIPLSPNVVSIYYLYHYPGKKQLINKINNKQL